MFVFLQHFPPCPSNKDIFYRNTKIIFSLELPIANSSVMTGSNYPLILIDIHRAQHFLVGFYLLYRVLLHYIEDHERTVLGTSQQMGIRRVESHVHSELSQLMPSVALNLRPRCFLNEATYGRSTKAYHWWQKPHMPFDCVQHRSAALPPKGDPWLPPPSVYQIPSHSHPYWRKVSARHAPSPARPNP